MKMNGKDCFHEVSEGGTRAMSITEHEATYVTFQHTTRKIIIIIIISLFVNILKICGRLSLNVIGSLIWQ